jgi:hypothetical protein
MTETITIRTGYEDLIDGLKLPDAGDRRARPDRHQRRHRGRMR